VKFAKASEWRGKPKMTIKKKGKTVAKDDDGHKSSTGTTGGAAGNFLHVDTVWHPGVSPETYEQHRNILVTGETRRVYWGVIHDADYPEEYRFVLDKHLARLEEQINDAEDTYLFVDALDRRKDFLWGKIEEIRKGTDFPLWMEDERVPAYYKETVKRRPDTRIDYWFLLSDLSIIHHRTFRKARPIEFEAIDRRKYGKAGRPFPCACDFDGYAELREDLEGRDTPYTQKAKKLKTGFTHSEDFRSVNWRGKKYTFTSKQAQAVEILCEHFEKGTPEVGKDYILEQLDSESSRLRDIFRKHPAWKALIVKGSKRGTYRLAL
jgi:hypothetical protein